MKFLCCVTFRCARAISEDSELKNICKRNFSGICHFLNYFDVINSRMSMQQMINSSSADVEALFLAPSVVAPSMSRFDLIFRNWTDHYISAKGLTDSHNQSHLFSLKTLIVVAPVRHYAGNP